MWNSPIPEKRWRGVRRESPGIAAFQTVASFEKAAVDELQRGLADHEAATVGRLIALNKKVELEVFIRTHGPNPLFDPAADLDVPVGVAKADVVDLHELPSAEANRAILDGQVLHVLFQAGEASRFAAGPLYQLNPFQAAQKISDDEELSYYLKGVNGARADVPARAADLLVETPLGPKQPLLIRAAIRRAIQDEIDAGRLSKKEAPARYAEVLANQKILFFVSPRGGVNEAHDKALRETFSFFGFHPSNLATIEQELARGLTANEDGVISLLEGETTMDAAGHLYAMMQAARAGDFTTYTESGRPIKPMEVDALSYFASRGAKIISIIRINDMDRHSTEIVNGKALGYALRMFENGYVNVIETVANPDGQKGGTGTTFGDPEIHVLTETHENSFPALSRAFDSGMQTYLKGSSGRHPAYNAMRQWADLAATRRSLQEFGARIVFVPRQKEIDGKEVTYLGVDMPMGDLSLLYGNYKSRMFQFAGPRGRELLIHDMKKKENLAIALRTLLRQLEDPHVVAVARELTEKKAVSFNETVERALYGAPCPEFFI